MKSHISKELLFLLFLTLISILCSCNKAEKDTNQVDHSEIIYCNFLTYDLTPQIVEAPQSAADYCAEMFYDKNNTLLHCEIKNIDTDSVKHRVEYNHDGSISKYELYYYGTTCFTYEYNNDGLLTKINDYFDDKLTGYSTFEYAKNNNCTKSYSFSPDGTLYSYSIYEYSNKGRKVYTYSPTGKLNFTKEYNSNGYPIKDTIYDKNGEIDTQIEYDEKGQIKKKIIYCGYGWKKIAEKNRESFYSDSNNLILCIDSPSEQSPQFKIYDSVGTIYFENNDTWYTGIEVFEESYFAISIKNKLDNKHFCICYKNEEIFICDELPSPSDITP